MATAAKKNENTSTLDALKNYDYERTSIRGKDGKVRHSASNGDALAKAMLIYTASDGDIGKLIKANGLQDKFDPSKWDNLGLLRMGVGNSLRALVRNGTPVVVGGITVKALDQKVVVPESLAAEKAEKKPRAAKEAA